MKQILNIFNMIMVLGVAYLTWLVMVMETSFGVVLAMLPMVAFIALIYDEKSITYKSLEKVMDVFSI